MGRCSRRTGNTSPFVGEGKVFWSEKLIFIIIYDKERMLIELLRNKNSLPYDLYKEVLMHYRERIQDLEIWRIQEYAALFPKSKMISKALDEEVL